MRIKTATKYTFAHNVCYVGALRRICFDDGRDGGCLRVWFRYGSFAIVCQIVLN